MSYIIKQGDSLWGIAARYYGDGKKYTKIYNANRKAEKGYNALLNPNKLSVGWKIKIPK